MRLGKLEKEVLAWIEKENDPEVISALHTFARFTRSVHDRSGHFNFAQISKLLDRLEVKGLIEIKNRYRMDARITLKEKSL
jgi:hypothetical protein